MEYDNILKDGKLTAEELERILQIYSEKELKDLYEYSLQILGTLAAPITRFEQIKNEYDVFSGDTFSKAYLNAQKIMFLAEHIAAACSPFIIKDKETDFQVLFQEEKPAAILTDIGFITSRLIKVKKGSPSYDGNLKTFREFLEKMPGVMNPFFSKYHDSFRYLLQNKNKDTLSHNEPSQLSDIVFYTFYLRNSLFNLEGFNQLENINFSDFKNNLKLYSFKDGEIKISKTPMDSSFLPILPASISIELGEAEEKSLEILNYLKEESSKIQTETRHYDQLISQKYQIPPFLRFMANKFGH